MKSVHNRLVMIALASLVVISPTGCAGSGNDNDQTADPPAVDTTSQASDTALTGVHVEVRRDPG